MVFSVFICCVLWISVDMCVYGWMDMRRYGYVSVCGRSIMYIGVFRIWIGDFLDLEGLDCLFLEIG